MPIDTAAKRRSAAGVFFIPLGPGVTPNASKPVSWRQQAAWSYSGIVALHIDTVTVPITGTVSIRPSVTGTISINPSATGSITILPSVTGIVFLE